MTKLFYLLLVRKYEFPGSFEDMIFSQSFSISEDVCCIVVCRPSLFVSLLLVICSSFTRRSFSFRFFTHRLLALCSFTRHSFTCRSLARRLFDIRSLGSSSADHSFARLAHCSFSHLAHRSFTRRSFISRPLARCWLARCSFVHLLFVGSLFIGLGHIYQAC